MSFCLYVLGQDKAGEGEGAVGRWQRPGNGPEEGDGTGGGQVQGDRTEQQEEDASRQPGHHQVGGPLCCWYLIVIKTEKPRNIFG